MSALIVVVCAASIGLLFAGVLWLLLAIDAEIRTW